jgi:hypothetical protein
MNQPVQHSKIFRESMRSAVAVSAPIVEAYPEWQETKAELRELERVAIAVAVPTKARTERRRYVITKTTNQASAGRQRA